VNLGIETGGPDRGIFLGIILIYSEKCL